MDDYTVSKIAWEEYQQRVQSLTPAQDHDARLTDDRRLAVYPIRAGVVVTPSRQRDVLKPIRRFFRMLEWDLAAMVIWMGYRRPTLPHGSPAEEERVLSAAEHKDRSMDCA